MPLRIAVTGDGAVCSLGRNVEEVMAALYAGVVQPPGELPPSTLEAPPAVFRVEGGPADPVRQTRTAWLAEQAAREALRRAWGECVPVAAARVGVCMGTTVGCTFNDEPFYRAWRGGAQPGSEAVERYLGGDLAAVVSGLVPAEGPRLTVANACASGTDALGIAAGWLASGACDLALAGGADALARFPYLGFAVLQNASRERCRPFDRQRRGLNLGEGAAVLVLEREADARRRGARILGLLEGWGSAADAHHPTSPHPEGRGLRRAIFRALEVAGLRADEVGFVNGHGTGTPDNDRVEGRVLADVFRGAPVVATKGATGHTLGAAGALEALFTVRNLLDGRLPPSAGFRTPDPDCVTVPNATARPLSARAAVSTSLAFGGTNSVLVLAREGSA